MNQEVGFIEAVDGTLNYANFPLGSLLFLLPYHVSLLHESSLPSCVSVNSYKCVFLLSKNPYKYIFYKMEVF